MPFLLGPTGFPPLKRKAVQSLGRLCLLWKLQGTAWQHHIFNLASDWPAVTLLVSPSVVTATPTKTSPLLYTSQALCIHELFPVLSSNLIWVKNKIWPSSSGNCFSASRGTGLVRTHPKTYTQVTPEKTNIGVIPHPGPGKPEGWTSSHSWAEAYPSYQGLLPSPWWPEDLSSEAVNSSLFLRTKTLTKKVKNNRKKEEHTLRLTRAGLDLHIRKWPWGHLSFSDSKLPPAVCFFWASTVQSSHPNLWVRLQHAPLTRHIDVDVLPFHFPILHLSVVIIANIQARMSSWGISYFEHRHEEATVVFFMSNVYPVASLSHWVLPAHFAVSRAFEREIGIQLYHHFIPIGNNSRQRKLAKC